MCGSALLSVDSPALIDDSVQYIDIYAQLINVPMP